MGPASPVGRGCDHGADRGAAVNDYEATFNVIGGGDWDRWLTTNKYPIEPALAIAEEVIAWLRSEPGHARENRSTMIDHYAYAIPNDAALDRLASLGPIVEVGAGAGYWAHLLRERG